MQYGIVLRMASLARNCRSSAVLICGRTAYLLQVFFDAGGQIVCLRVGLSARFICGRKHCPKVITIKLKSKGCAGSSDAVFFRSARRSYYGNPAAGTAIRTLFRIRTSYIYIIYSRARAARRCGVWAEETVLAVKILLHEDGVLLRGEKQRSAVKTFLRGLG